MPKPKILVVDDEESLQELLKYHFEREGFEPHCVGSGEEALSYIRAGRPDLVVLDLMLPGMHGFEVLRAMRSNPSTSSIPVIILTARGEDADIVAGLEQGADDYVTKPFSPKVLVARIGSILRRGRRKEPPKSETIKIHGITIDVVRHEVKVGREAVELTATEFALLKHLASYPGYVFTRAQLIEAVKGGNYPVTERSVDVQIVGLRKKLGAMGRAIETVRGVGYRMKEER